MPAIVALDAILLILCLVIPNPATPGTLDHEGFIGVWETETAMAFSPRQRFTLSGKAGGSWEMYWDDGRVDAFDIASEDIRFIDDFLYVHVTVHPTLAFRVVLGGWETVGGSKAIFGTLYLYHDVGDGMALFNGVPFSLRPAVGPPLPLQLWLFLSGDPLQQMDEETMADLIKAVDEHLGPPETEAGHLAAYSAREDEILFVSQDGFDGHPLVMSASASRLDRTEMEFRVAFIHSEERARIALQEITADVEEALRATERWLEQFSEELLH